MIVQGIERTCTDKRFDYTPVDDALIHPVAEIEQIEKRSMLLARTNNRVNRGFACSLDCPQSVSYGFFVCGNKAVTGKVDVRRQHGEPICQAVFEKRMYL